jgi:phage-related protein (TIGR01555 family)
MTFDIFGFFRRKKLATAVAAAALSEGQTAPHDVLSLSRRGSNEDADDRWKEGPANPIQRTIEDFPLANAFGTLADGAAVKIADGYANNSTFDGGSMSPELLSWYASQSFIGFQACAIIAQHWLISKACSLAPEDALRNGWTLDLVDTEKEDGAEDIIEQIQESDTKMDLKTFMFQAGRFCNIFGIRVMIPIIESPDKDYYSKPFNIDGVTQGSFRGWNQIDPLWLYPVLDSVGAGDPNSKHFYEPLFWQAGGVQYHRSHLIIIRTAEVADILKPTYLFAGLSLTQRIYERVYAAERVANEAPLLAMSKRSTVLKVDLAKAGMKKQSFLSRISEWVQYRDNFNIKVIGKDEDVSENDTSLADLDDVIMTSFQLVAAIAAVPATKLLETSPKGFGTTGEGESRNYHESLESIQSSWYTPFLDRHYLLLAKSRFNGITIKHAWEPVDTATAEQEATIQKMRADTGAVLITSGAISPDEERARVRMDKNSNYLLSNDEETPLLPTAPTEEVVAAGDALSSEKDDADEAAILAVTAAACIAVAETAPNLEVTKTPSGRTVINLVAKLANALDKANPTVASAATVSASTTGSVKGIKPFSNNSTETTE